MWICIRKKYVFLGIILIFIIFFWLGYTSIAYFEENTTKNVERTITKEIEENFRNIYKDDEKIAYLTFDDGPSKYTTRKILDVLERFDVKATFFVLREMCH